ncbi:MAG: helix-turn-helix domain-containing protein [Caldilineaceae bacterium]|nr:helix-turn-helix domain-containing protein [Caldilineaceae bacterium]
MSDSHLDSLELSSSEAGQILNVSTRTINRYVKREMLTARLQGMKRVARISIDDLRTFAESYGFVVNEVVVEEIAAARKK